MVELIDPAPLEGGFEAMFLGLVTLKGGKTGEQWVLASAYHPDARTTDLDRKSSYFQLKRRGWRPIGGVYSCKGTVEDGHIQTLNANMSFLRSEKGPVIDEYNCRKLVREQEERRSKAEAKAKGDDALKALAERVAVHAEKLPWGDRSAFLAAFSDLVRKAIEERKRGRI